MIQKNQVSLSDFQSWEGNNGSCKYHKKYFSDTIYTLDIEVSSLFKINDKWQPFIYDDSIDYTQIEHAACPYIWMFGVEGHVIYGREFLELGDVFRWMADPFTAKVIYIFNMSYEMGFLLDVLGEYHIEHMVARDIRKPIEFYVKELNIYFRCAYMLTNMSLEVAAKEYTDLEKKSGTDYDYNVARSPLTVLDQEHLEYCEYDILTLWQIIAHFREQYGHTIKIPLTSTSIVRRALKDVVDFYYIRKQWGLVPEPRMFMREIAIFSGGYCHTNLIHSGKIMERVKSKDEASKYPGVMSMEKYPRTRFLKCSPSDYRYQKDTHAFFFYVKFDNVRSKFYNHYMQKSKAIHLQGDVLDNGRISRCEHVEYWLTDCDLEIILQCYNCRYEIVEAYKAAKDYLDVRILLFILDLYGKKTSLKGLTDPQSVAIYKHIKPQINGLFGMSARNVLKELTEFNDKDDPEAPNQWSHIDWNDIEVRKKFIEQKLEESKQSFSTLFQYVIGCWVSAFARRDLFLTMTGHVQQDDGSWLLVDKTMDRDSIYCDTDSIKYINPEEHEALFQQYNQHVVDKMQKVVDKFPQISIDMFMPKDRKGVQHPINFFEEDGDYEKFVALGAKKYCYIEDGELHITVSGVAKTDKTGHQKMLHIEEFKKGYVWGYKDSGKLVHFYNDDQEPFTFTDCDGNEYHCTQRHVVVLQPTSYTLGLTDWYEYLLSVKNKGLLKNQFISGMEKFDGERRIR